MHPEASNMRKLSLIGGIVLALSAATSTFAFSPVTQVTTTTSHRWATSYKDGAATVTSVLTASSTYGTGKLSIHVSGATKDERITISLLDRIGTTTHVLLSHTVMASAGGVYASTWSLSSTVRADLKALASTSKREVRTSLGGKTVTGIFVAK
jgi:hypothetical protein